MRRMRWAIAATAAMAVVLLAVGCSREKASPAKARAPKASAAGEGRVAWAASYDQAVVEAKEQGKPVMVDVMASWCGVCKKLDAQVWTREDVAKVSEGFVAAKVDGDKEPGLKSKLTVSGYPTTLFLTAEGKELGRVRGLVAPEDMIEAMQDALGKAK
jgi:thiol:disulfide interchange protein